MMSDQQREEGLRIRAERKAQRMTQAELAEAAGVAVRTVQSIEHGDRANHPNNVAAVKAVLGLAGEPEATREGWPIDIQVALDMIGAYLNTLDEGARLEWIRGLTRDIIGGNHG